MESQPLFIIGAPRSGTTFLCNALNRHPLIHLTNESRVFVLVENLLQVQSRRPDLLDPASRKGLTSFVRRNAGMWVEQFYREELGIRTPIWGDKHPPYADPFVICGYPPPADPRLRSGSCLRTVIAALPHAKFIHLHRDPRHVAYSLLGKHWVNSLDEGVAVWRRYVEEIEGFFAEIDADRYLTLCHADLVERPDEATAAITAFLRLPDDAGIADFLLAEQRKRTPFSEPVTDLASPRGSRLTAYRDQRSLLLAGDHAARLGYM